MTSSRGPSPEPASKLTPRILNEVKRTAITLRRKESLQCAAIVARLRCQPDIHRGHPKAFYRGLIILFIVLSVHKTIYYTRCIHRNSGYLKKIRSISREPAPAGGRGWLSRGAANGQLGRSLRKAKVKSFHSVMELLYNAKSDLLFYVNGKEVSLVTQNLWFILFNRWLMGS